MPEQRKRLADLMNARRVELGLRWADVAAAAGVSEETLRVIRRTARPVRDLTWAGVEKALRWQPGSVSRVLAGGDPQPAAAQQFTDPALRAIWELPGLPEDVRRGMIALATGMRQPGSAADG